jgi:hypothetical protein
VLRHHNSSDPEALIASRLGQICRNPSQTMWFGTGGQMLNLQPVNANL